MRCLTKYLLKYGHRTFEYREGRQDVQMNVASEIFRDLDADGVQFENKSYNTILDLYRRLWHETGEGVEIPAHHFINHTDPDVCNAAVDLLTSDDNYVPSEIWRKKEVHVESEEEILAAGVPKAIILYKSKVVERMIKEQRDLLADADLSEERQAEILRYLSDLNGIKVSLANKLQRSIL